VVRWPVRTLLPTPAVRRRLFDLIAAESPDVVVFGAAMPLALLGPPIRRRFGVPYVTFTHGLEVAAARLPGGPALLRQIGRDAALVTTVSRWTAEILRPCFGSATRVVQLPVGVDVERFNPDVSAADVRERHRLGSGPIISAVSRLVPRKGHDQVIRALPEIRHAFPAVRFLVVGAGPDEARLRALATRHGVNAHVVFAGAVTCDDLPAYFRAGDVFAMPCRHRWAGLDVEAFGSVYLQAAAAGRVTVAGHAGGVPEAVEHGQTGLVVDGTQVGEVAAALLNLLHDPDRAAAMGKRGAARARADFSWEVIAARLRGLLQEVLSRA
jgi:phosphatidyl-myo-inositol dimannoside synthase